MKSQLNGLFINSSNIVMNDWIIMVNGFFTKRNARRSADPKNVNSLTMRRLSQKSLENYFCLQFESLSKFTALFLY
jgi:hypothetical protein